MIVAGGGQKQHAGRELVRQADDGFNGAGFTAGKVAAADSNNGAHGDALLSFSDRFRFDEVFLR